MTEPTAVAEPGDQTKYHYHRDGSIPGEGVVFVFGSNEAGRHGKGAALTARELFGAKYGHGIGRTGMAYGIPAKDNTPRPATPRILPLTKIRAYVADFLGYAAAHPELDFFVCRVGCGLAQYTNDVIAPLFSGAPINCSFAVEWQQFLEEPALLQQQDASQPPRRAMRP
jgi:hypothetical protein